MPEFGVAQVQRPIVAVAKVLAWDNSERADRGKRAALRTTQRVLAMSSNTRLRSGPRQVELAQEHVSRVGTVALTARPGLADPPRALGDRQRLEDQARAWPGRCE